MIIIRLIGPRDEKIQNPEEIKSKGPRQRQFTITGWTDDRQIVLTGAMDSEKAKSGEYTGWTDEEQSEGVGAIKPEAEARV